MRKIEIIEQIVAVVVTTILVMANFFLFTPWRNGQDPRKRQTQTRRRSEVLAKQIENRPTQPRLT